MWSHICHGSRANVTEMELSVPARRCLDRRIPDLGTLKSELAAWEKQRDAATVDGNWQFTIADARVKLKKLCPNIQLQGTTDRVRRLHLTGAS